MKTNEDQNRTGGNGGNGGRYRPRDVRRPSRVRVFDLGRMDLEPVFGEIADLPAARLVPDGIELLRAAGVPDALINSSESSEHIELSAHEPAQDGASGPLGHLGVCIGRAVA